MEMYEMQEKCYQQALKSGWNVKKEDVPEMIALLHSEVSEALEEFRNNKPLIYTGEGHKPEGLAVEFADVLIRLFHYSSVLGINLETVTLQKMAYNATRPHRHGGKAC